MNRDEILETLERKFADDSLSVSFFRGDARVICPAVRVAAVLGLLKEECGLDMLADLTAVDYLEYPDARDRFAVIYSLASTITNVRLWIKVLVNDPDPTLPSVVSLWRGADWMEREVYDMFGIRFEGHPDLRRILMPEEFSAFPLRKDYPLRGRGERHNFPVLTRADS